MNTSCQQNVVGLQNQNIIIRNLSIENVKKFKYVGVTVTNTNRPNIRKEIKSYDIKQFITSFLYGCET